MKVLLDAPITFDVKGGKTHAPMVHAAIGDVPIRLILDTGSTDHMLTAELCDSMGMATESGELGTDSSGGSVPSWRVGEVSIRIGSRTFALRDLVVVSAPEPFRKWDIGGILSPQHLHPAAHVLLDLVADRLVMLDDGPEEDDVTAWLSDRFPRLRSLSLEPVERDGTVLVQAAIEPFEPFVTMLDTGARSTYVDAASVPGLKGGPLRSAGHAIGGGETVGAEVRGQVLRIGDIAMSLDILMGCDTMGPAGAIIGMDLIRGTVLVVGGPPSRPIRWLVP